jgi:hypothetical protein
LPVSFGYWQSRTRRNPFPAKPAVDYSIRFANNTVVNLSVPWAIQCTKNYTGVGSFLKDYWAPPASAARKASAKAQQRDQPLVHQHETLMHNVEHVKPTLQAQPNQTFTMLVNSTDLTFWKLSDNKTLVMYLDTFGPARY